MPYDAVVEKADGSEVVYAVEPNSEKEGSYVVTEVPVTTGLETDFYIEVSGDGITDGLSIVSDPQSVAPGHGGHPGLCRHRHHPSHHRPFQ